MGCVVTSVAMVAFLVGGATAYVCDECAFAVVGLTAAEDPRATTFRVLEVILRDIPASARYVSIEPVFEALLAAAGAKEDWLERAHTLARRFEHAELAYRALAAISPVDRSREAWLNLAAWLVELERNEEALVVLDQAPISLRNDVWASMHRAMVHAKAGRLTSNDAAALVERASGSAPLQVEALHVLALARRNEGDIPGALAALDSALAIARDGSRLLCLGDVLVGHDPARARAAWEEALTRVHPDGVVATRARERLARMTAR